MWILALNTATDALSVGVVQVTEPAGTPAPTDRPGRSAVELLCEPPPGRSGHSERLMPLVDTAVKLAGLTPAWLDGVAVVAGPGGFTGVRTGLAAAKLIAQSLGIPLWGVDTLDALAAGYTGHGLVASLLDARRGMVFARLYRIGSIAGHGTSEIVPTGSPDAAKAHLLGHPSPAFDDSGAPAVATLEPLGEPRLVELTAFLADLPAGEPIAFVGEGALRHAQRLGEHPGAILPAAELHAIRPTTIARLAAPHLAAGGEDPLTLLPRYLRAPTMAPDWVAGSPT